MSNLIERVETYSTTHNLFEANNQIVVGLSGGPDSVFLLHALHHLKNRYNLTLLAAHLDHGWRQDSNKDVVFCKNLAESLGIIFISKHAQEIIPLKKTNGSLEEQGRNLRRIFLQDVMHEYGAHKIALAHHSDDQLETFFIRLTRGAGIAGLSGIRPIHGHYIRPLLFLRKANILTYLEDNKISFLSDSTNIDDAHLRNRVRKYVLPACDTIDPRFTENALKSIGHLQETEVYLEMLTHTLFQECTEYKNNSYILDITKFCKQDYFMQKRILLSWFIKENVSFIPTTAFFHEALRFLSSPRGGKHAVHTSWSIIKKNNLASLHKQ